MAVSKEMKAVWETLEPLDADKVIAALPEGQIHTFMGMGGCDIDTSTIIEYIEADGVRKGDEQIRWVGLGHDLVVVDRWGKLISIEITFSEGMRVA